MLTYPDVCCRMLPYADVCCVIWRVLDASLSNKYRSAVFVSVDVDALEVRAGIEV